MNNSGYTEYKCECCNVSFGNKASNYRNHLKTNKHKIFEKQSQEKQIKINEITKETNNEKRLLEKLCDILGKREQTQEVELNIKDVYKRNQIRKPNKSFNKYFSMNNIVKYCNLSDPYKPVINIIYEGIVNMVKNTKSIDIPVLIANKQHGSRGKIYYYNDSNNFEYQSVTKRRERTLFVRLCSILRSASNNIFATYLNEMFETIPDELKIYFNNINLGEEKIYDPHFNCKHYHKTIAWYDFVCISDFSEEDEEQEACTLSGCTCWNTYTESELYSINRKQHRYLNKNYFNYINELVRFDSVAQIQTIKDDLIEYISNNKYYNKFITFLKMNNCARQKIWSGSEQTSHVNIQRLMDLYTNKTTQLLTELEDDFNMDEIYNNIIEEEK